MQVRKSNTTMTFRLCLRMLRLSALLCVPFVSCEDESSGAKRVYDLKEEAQVREGFERQGELTKYPQKTLSVELFQTENSEELKPDLPPDEHGPYTKYVSPVLMRRTRRAKALRDLAFERYLALTDEERDVYIAKEKKLNDSYYQRIEEQRKAVDHFHKELDQLAESHQQQPPSPPNDKDNGDEDAPFEQYPDHEFAIEESQLYFDWNFASFILMEHVVHNPVSGSLLQKTILQSNLPSSATIPLFVDSGWSGDQIYSCSARRGNGAAEGHLTGYYKVHPPNDKFIPSNPIEKDEAAIPFNVTSFRRYLQNIRQDLAGAEWANTLNSPKGLEAMTEASKPSNVDFEGRSRTVHQCRKSKIFMHSIEMDDALVLSFITKEGDRIEYYHPEDLWALWGSYVILQTANGRLLIVANNRAHPYVFSNLLEFFNSDGSGSMPPLFPEDYDSFHDAQQTAETLVQNTLDAAMSFLYQQEH